MHHRLNAVARRRGAWLAMLLYPAWVAAGIWFGLGGHIWLAVIVNGGTVWVLLVLLKRLLSRRIVKPS